MARAQRWRLCARTRRKRPNGARCGPFFARHSSLLLSCRCYLHGCPCGFYNDATRECRCTAAIIARYMSKISGPLLDRIDIHIDVPAVKYAELRGKVAPTVADLECAPGILSKHLAEAVHYRSLDRTYWV